MKYLKYLLGVITLFVLLFFGRGLLAPNVTYNSEITVDKPLAEAWAVANDESKTTEWLKGLTKVEHVSGEKGAVGAVTQYTFVQDGQASIILETLKAIRPNEHVAMDFLMEGVMAMDYQMDYSEKDGKTHIKSTTVAEGQGLFMRSIFAWTSSSMVAQEDENLGNLKTVIEANTTDYFPAPEITAEAVEEVVVGEE